MTSEAYVFRGGTAESRAKAQAIEGWIDANEATILALIAGTAVVVPVEPTETMWDAAEACNQGGGIADNGGGEPDIYDIGEVWDAMLKAAQTTGKATDGPAQG